MRAISRLLFFHMYPRFRQKLDQKTQAVLQNVSNQHLLDELGLSISPDLRIVVIASTAGGTGSGAFIDVGYACSSLRFGDKVPQVDLFLMLPGGYAEKDRERVFANTYAGLSELEHTMRPNSTPALRRAVGRVRREPGGHAVFGRLPRRHHEPPGPGHRQGGGHLRHAG